MSEREHSLNLNIPAPPADAVARLHRRVANCAPWVTRCDLPTIEPAAHSETGKRPRLRGRPRTRRGPPPKDTPPETHAKKRKFIATNAVRVEVVADPKSADLVCNTAKTYGLTPGTLIHLLVVGKIRIRTDRKPDSALPPRTKPQHIGWKISRRDFRALAPLAAVKRVSVGSYCLATALEWLRGAGGNSSGGLLLDPSERQTVLLLHKVLSTYSALVTLRFGSDKTLFELRRAAQTLRYQGVDRGQVEQVHQLVELTVELETRARYGADFSETKEGIHELAMKIGHGMH